MAREIGQCALCRSPRVPLCDSHFIPRAIAKWAKSKAREGEQKAFWDVNNRRFVQDFHHAPMLCECCENLRFGKREDKFMTRIFKPYQDNGRAEFTYDEWLRYYSVSEGWRLLHHLLELVKAGSTEGLNDKLLQHLCSPDTKTIYETWRNYLLENEDDPGTAQYIYFFDYNYRQLSRMTICMGDSVLGGKYGKLMDAGPVFGEDRFALVTNTFGVLLVSTVKPEEWPELKKAKLGASGTLDIKTEGYPPKLLTEWIRQRTQKLKEYIAKTRH